MQTFESPLFVPQAGHGEKGGNIVEALLQSGLHLSRRARGAPEIDVDNVKYMV